MKDGRESHINRVELCTVVFMEKLTQESAISENNPAVRDSVNLNKMKNSWQEGKTWRKHRQPGDSGKIQEAEKWKQLNNENTCQR